MGWKLAELFVDLSLKTQDFDDTLKQAFKNVKKSRDDMARGAAIEMPALRGVSVANAVGDSGAAIAAARMNTSATGDAIGAAMSRAMGGMGAMGARMILLLDRLGGAVVRMFKRIDSTMKLAGARASFADFQAFALQSFRAMKTSAVAAFLTIHDGQRGLAATARFTYPYIRSLFAKMSTAACKDYALIGKTFLYIEKQVVRATKAISRFMKSQFAQTTSTIVVEIAKIAAAYARIPIEIGRTAVAFSRFAATTWNWVSSFGKVSKKSMSTLLHLPMTAIAAPVKAGSAAMDVLIGKTRTWTGSLKHIGMNLAAGAGFAGLEYLVVGAFKNMIRYASQTETAQRELTSVFGRSSSVIEGTADRLAGTFGVVRNDVRQASVAFGNLFEGIGKSRAEAATMSAKFVELAANMAQAKSIPLDEAAQKLTLSLAGSTRGLAQFGIRLRESDVEARAIALGFAKVGEDLSEEARTAAQADLVFRRLTSVQGALKQATGDYSQSTTEAAGRVKNFQETIGDILLPAFERMTAYVNIGLRAFNGYSNGVASAASRVRDALTSVIDGAAYVAVNWDLVWGMAQVKTNEFATNVFIGLDYLKNVMSAFADWAASDWLNTFRTAFAGAAFAVESAIMGMQKAIVKAVDSFYGTDKWSAIEIEWGKELNKLAGMVNKGMAGMRKVNPPQFADFGDQLRKLEADAKARFARLQKGLPGKSPFKEGVLPAIDNDASKNKNKDKHAETLGLVEYAKKLQEGVGGKDAQAKKMVAEQEKTNKILLARLPNRPMANRPLAGFARAAP